MTSPPDYPTLDRLLDQYRGSQVESEGRFTLNPERARELLGRYRLRHPDEYILHLVSFLIGAGAKAVTIDLTGATITIQAEGGTLDEETLRNPFGVIVRSTQEPHLAELGIGLNAFLVDPKHRFEMSFGGLTSRYEDGVFEISRAEVRPGIRLALETGKKLGDEETLLRQAFLWSPVPVRLEYEDLTEALDREQSAFELHLENRRYPLRLENTGTRRIRKPVAADFSALLRVGGSQGRIRIIVLGRCFEKPSPWVLSSGALPVDLVIHTDRFQKDLAHQQIVEDQLYQNLLASLQEQLLGALEFLVTQDALPTEMGTIVEHLVEAVFTSGRTELAAELQRRLCHRLSKKADSLSKGIAVYRFGLIQEALRSGEGRTNLRLGAQLMDQTDDPYSELAMQWEMVRARMVFAPKSAHLASQVATVAIRGDSVTQVLCYRWLACNETDVESRIDARLRLIELMLKGDALETVSQQLEAAQTEITMLPSTIAAAAQENLSQLQAEFSLKTGHLEQAIRHLEDLLITQTNRFGRTSTRLGLTLTRLALLVEQSGDRRQARELRRWCRSLKS